MRGMRKVLATACLMAAAAFVPAGCAHDSGSIIGPPGATLLPDLHSIGLDRAWDAQLNLAPGEHVKKAWRVGTSVYVSTSAVRIARIDAASGTLMWTQSLGKENFDIYQPVEIKDPDGGPPRQLLVVTRGALFYMNMLTGDLNQFPVKLGLSISTDPILVRDMLCLGAQDTYYGRYVDRPFIYHWDLPEPGDTFISSPVQVDDDIVIATRKGHLFRVHAADGDWEWKDRRVNGEVVAGLAADETAVYVPSLDQRVYAFRIDTGGELWESQVSGRLENTPVLAGSVVLVLSRNNGLYSLNAKDGALKWEVPDVAQIAMANDTNAWVGDQQGNIREYSLETGDQVASAPTPGVQLFVTNTVDENVILITTGGHVGMYAERKKQ